MFTIVLVFYLIRGRYHSLFKEDFDLRWDVMEYEDKWCLGLFLIDLKWLREKLKHSIQPQQLTNREWSWRFLAPWLMLQANQGLHGSWLGHLKGVTIDQALQMCHTCRLLPSRSQPMHRPFLSINKVYFGLVKDDNISFFLFSTVGCIINNAFINFILKDSCFCSSLWHHLNIVLFYMWMNVCTSWSFN